jgi:hypothetical protein
VSSEAQKGEEVTKGFKDHIMCFLIGFFLGPFASLTIFYRKIKASLKWSTGEWGKIHHCKSKDSSSKKITIS